MAGGTIAVASDHAGFDLKEILKRDLQEAGLEVLDLGTHSTASVDYPDFGQAMAETIAAGNVERGVLICGTGGSRNSCQISSRAVLELSAKLSGAGGFSKSTTSLS